jgi:hypothetical protein
VTVMVSWHSRSIITAKGESTPHLQAGVRARGGQARARPDLRSRSEGFRPSSVFQRRAASNQSREEPAGREELS